MAVGPLRVFLFAMGGTTVMSGRKKCAVKNSGDRSVKRFPIVGIGASAGGLKALNSFFGHVSCQSHMAYLVVTHMSRKQPSMLPELLQKITPLPVQTAADGKVIQPGHIYINPPDSELSLFHGKIQLLDLAEKDSRFPIDRLFKSLAIDQEKYAVAIVLSGTGTDGTSGVREIKAREGLVVVQDEKSASYDGMPRSAVSTGLADMVLPPEAMPAALERCFLGPHIDSALDQTLENDAQPDWLGKIFNILRVQAGHDFSAYKSTTTLRRISRRMGLNQIDSHEVYAQHLQKNKTEVEALFRELLIGVTSFFREPLSFELLKKKIIPKILEQKGNETVLRAWIPACSTGEEVYSLAIVLNECLEKVSTPLNLQLFGTDINGRSIDTARQGIYPASISADVGAKRLRRFFTKEGDLYVVSKSIRDCVIFSTQDVLKDPPFSRLDLLCCRNLLIYLNNDAQKKLLPLFHYTLRREGILMLGSSETIGGFSSLFDPVDKRYKVFRKREVPRGMRQLVDFPAGPSHIAPATDFSPIAAENHQNDFAEITRKLILSHYAPAAILIDENSKVLYIQGRTGRYLESPTGPPTHNIVELARDGLRIELSSAIRKAKTSSQPVTRRRISFQSNNDTCRVNLHVFPQGTPKAAAGRLLVLFEDAGADVIDPGSEKDLAKEVPPDPKSMLALEKELQSIRESHRCTIEELESSNEELKSTNEELQSTNEELQSINEELESSKEELQSLNEEMQTVNSELQAKVEELSASHDDMRNLLNSTEIATIFVDNDMRLRRYTQEATRIINLIQTDIGRPLQHVATNLMYDGMTRDIQKVLTDLVSTEIEVQSTKGVWFTMRIIPYRTLDNRIAGAVITFSNVDEQKRAQTVLKESIYAIQHSEALARFAFDMNRQPLAVIDQTGTIVMANTALSRLTGAARDEIAGIRLLESLNIRKQSNTKYPDLEHMLTLDTDFQTSPFVIGFKNGEVSYVIKGRVIRQNDDSPYRCLIQLVKPRKKRG